MLFLLVMLQHIVIVANGEPPSAELLDSALTPNTMLVAVDGGLETCHAYGKTPDLITGDFDSTKLLQIYDHVEQLYTENQDKTDLEKALDYILTFPITKITVLGALGKRLDHSLTNLILLTRYPKIITFETDLESCFALDYTTDLQCQKGQTLSLIPFNGPVTGIETSGLKWELNDGTLDKEFVGISNVCLEEEISISFETGDLVCCLPR